MVDFAIRHHTLAWAAGLRAQGSGFRVLLSAIARYSSMGCGLLGGCQLRQRPSSVTADVPCYSLPRRYTLVLPCHAPAGEQRVSSRVVSSSLYEWIIKRVII